MQLPANLQELFRIAWTLIYGENAPTGFVSRGVPMGRMDGLLTQGLVTEIVILSSLLLSLLSSTVSAVSTMATVTMDPYQLL